MGHVAVAKPTSGRLDAVGRTSLLTAAMRAIESRRSDRLFEDPYAHRLCGQVGPCLLEELRAATLPAGQPRRMPDVLDVNAVRTRFFDDRLRADVHEGTQVVLPASGMDCRAYRTEWPRGVRWYEIDRPAVVAHKQARLADVRPCVDRRAVGADLTGPNWERRLVAAGYEPQVPSVWLLEGLLCYLREGEVNDLLDRIRRVTAPGSVLLADCVGAAAFTVPHASGQLNMFARWGCPWHFGTDEPEVLFSGHGMRATSVQPGEAPADYPRWSHAVPPRSAGGVRRIFLIRAVRG
ncbi:SAM-dependent methyltransferase [Streptomyces sp. B22F1]|uniref:SAM-dependent methyltransferase n=1 Tax=Streptomyces sp. B22F1 TaxID=3153566 RepID=UPI00325F430D